MLCPKHTKFFVTGHQSVDVGHVDALHMDCAGKTTLLRLIAGLEEASSGSVHFGGGQLWQQGCVESKQVSRQTRVAVAPML